MNLDIVIKDSTTLLATLLTIVGLFFILVSKANISGKFNIVVSEKDSKTIFHAGIVIFSLGLIFGIISILTPERLFGSTGGTNQVTKETNLPIEEIAPEIKITSPSNGTSVDIITNIEGRGKNIPNNKILWIIVYPHKTNDYHPAVEANNRDGEFYFGVPVTVGTTNSAGDKFDVLAALADEKSNEEFKTYLDTSNKNQVWPGIKNLPVGVKEYDRVTVIRK